MVSSIDLKLQQQERNGSSSIKPSDYSTIMQHVNVEVNDFDKNVQGIHKEKEGNDFERKNYIIPPFEP